MKILCFSLSPSHLKGIVYQKGIQISQFECPLENFSPMFFSHLGIDQNKCYLSLILTDHLSLYKETTLENLPKTSVKKLVQFYAPSQFPIEEADAYFITDFQKVKNSLKLSSHALLKESFKKIIDQTSCLGLVPDGLFSWQKALVSALDVFKPDTGHQLIFYQNQNHLYILQKNGKKIILSTLLKIKHGDTKNLEPALNALKDKITSDHSKVVLIGTTRELDTLIDTTLKPANIERLSDVNSDYLLHIGAAALSEKKAFNLFDKLPKVSRPSLFLKPTFQKLIKLNLVIGTCFTLGALLLFGTSLYKNSTKLQQSHPFHHLNIRQGLAFVDHLKTLSGVVCEAPSPLEVIAYLSSHTALNKLDNESLQAATLNQLSYELINLKKAKVKFSLQFPKEAIKQEFEKSLKLKKIPFTQTHNAHVNTYEIELTKHQLSAS